MLHTGIKQPEKVFAAFRPKDFIIGTFLGILCQMIFQQIYQKISLHQNLIIRLVYIGVGVMVSHQIAEPVDHFLRPAKTGRVPAIFTTVSFDLYYTTFLQ